MSDTFIRHLIALCGLLIAVALFFAGYVAGTNSWWWVSFGLVFIYMIVYKIVNAGGHH